MILLLAVSLISSQTAHLQVGPALDALAQVETGGIVKRGAAGERGPYQIKREVWERWSTQPFSVADTDSLETQRVVKSQLHWIMERLEEVRYRPTPEMIGQVWNAGWTTFRSHRTTPAQRDFGVRFGRLYHQLVSEEPEATKH